ncbi:MAG: adenine nucleotide alpha hydrolase family protein [Nitriliruptoraceae bacterium]|nr:adenine nucleotide alpha hydrolase family protein [Nitriliruptoraceae bacterium]
MLVLHDGALVTRDHELPAGAQVEIRPVVSGGAGGPRCVVCGAGAVHEEPRHRASWCPTHLQDHVANQVRRAIDHPPGAPEGARMLHYGERVLIAVSGGKDSLALWDVLHRLGYHVDGLYVGLGIGGYSTRSGEVCRAFAAERGLHLHELELAERYGYTTPSGAGASGRSTCGVCGLSKRHAFDEVAVEHGYDALVTGHNLDDEAATLLGNVIRWQEHFLARQSPYRAGRGPTQPRKVKPLYRLSERETAAYCVVAGIDYVLEECPLVDGNTGHELKGALDLLEAPSPGLKAQFLFGFLDRVADHFDDEVDDDHLASLRECRSCRLPTPNEVCAFCRQRERILAVLPGAGDLDAEPR